MKLIKNLTINTIIYFIIKFVYACSKRYKKIRRIDFDNFKDNDFRFYNKDLKFILFSQDKYVSRSTYINGPYDYQLITRSIKILRKKINYLIDVGSNLGTTCIPAVKRNLIKECIAIEPVEKIYKILNINIQLNNLENNIKTYCNVVSNDNEQNVSIIHDKNNYGNNKFKITNSKNNQFKTIKLDSFIDKFNTDQLVIKIDVQGFEDKVLLGAKKFINKQVPLIIEIDYQFSSSNIFEPIISLINKNYSYFYILDKIDNRQEIKNFIDSVKSLKAKKKYHNYLIY